MRASEIFNGRSWMRRIVDKVLGRRQEPEKKEEAASGGVDLLGVLGRIRDLFAGLGAVELQAKDRQRLGGMIFAGADVFVRGVAQGLRERPDLFDVPGVSGEELERRQRRARAWFWVKAALLRMAEDAGDSYLYEQGTAIEEASRVIQVVKNEAEARRLRGEEGPDIRGMEQQAALHQALWMMDRRAEGKQRARRRAAKQEAEAKKPPAQREREQKEQTLKEAYAIWRERHAKRVKRGVI